MRPVLLCGLAVVAGAACGDGAAGSDSGSVDVVAQLYPLQYVAQRIGGDRISVGVLTPPGVEPHDLELAADDLGRLADADLVVHLAGLAPAVDEAIAAASPAAVLDVGRFAELEAGRDPHFWLDPVRLAGTADEVAAAITDADPAGSDTYDTNLTTLLDDLAALDAELGAGLADCASTDLVTSHAAFDYLAERYGLRPIGIAGAAPGAEPSPGRVAEVVQLVEARGVRTIYSEPLTSTDLVETIAAETGVATAVLDPLEGLTEDSVGDDYLEVMRANLVTLREGQGCS